MKKILLNDIRLSYYFILSFFSFFVVIGVLPKFEFENPVLLAFMIVSLLFGLLSISLLVSQKLRIEKLHKIVRSEANAIFSIMLATKKSTESVRSKLQVEFNAYLTQLVNKRRDDSERTYQGIISFCLSYKGKDQDVVDHILSEVIANQTNRTSLSMQLANKVYSNEWLILNMLFMIDAIFVMFSDYGDDQAIRLVYALLASVMFTLVIVVVKLSTLSHKKAKEIWNPFKSLLSSGYYQVENAHGSAFRDKYNTVTESED